MTKTITVVSCEKKKSGNTNGRNWTMWEVVDDKGLKYTDFSGLFQDKLGAVVTINYTEKQNGKFTNRTILNPATSKPSKREQNEDNALDADRMLFDIHKGVAYLIQEIRKIEKVLNISSISVIEKVETTNQGSITQTEDLPF